ncbi:bifunctional metallophosphatase/5'-nucleotidase [Sphingomonas sp.]|uniref:bifunctional metallophosphatase/5'-nucleotidase n=1 Tax=Sphingomonas sp. TaxID=28214 RepID=UPI0025F9B2AB|nr:bifunctional metallophosphatase/5'-nucleotidase [Sphingomonas sp.]
MRILPIGLTALLAACATVPQTTYPIEVQILAINDFHGNLETPEGTIPITGPDGADVDSRVGGAAQLAGTLKVLRNGHANSITVAAGDLIGASPLASAWFLDEPTIDALSLAGLELASVGNHEFDKGSSELLRMQKGGCEKYTTRQPCQLERFKGAGFTYLAANALRADGSTLFPATAIRRYGPVKVGFIGMTLKDTGILASPAGVAGLTFADEAATANALVPKLKAEGADTVVLLIHQGAKSPKAYQTESCEGLAGPILDILDHLDPAIRTIVSGHTHQAYACTLDRGGAPRLLTSAGKYGFLVTDIRLDFDPRSRGLVASAARNVPVEASTNGDPKVAQLTGRYVKAAAPVAERVIGRLSGPAPRSETEDESPAASLVADAELYVARQADKGRARIAFTNATGVRTGLFPKADGSVSFGQIFQMQPFGNNLVTKNYTGAQLKAVLEQQFRTVDGAGRVGSLLIPSAGFRFRYDLARPQGDRIILMELDGKRIDPAASYRVTVNNFLASGGDGFSALSAGSDAVDGGMDLDAMEAWLVLGQPVPAMGRTKD